MSTDLVPVAAIGFLTILVSWFLNPLGVAFLGFLAFAAGYYFRNPFATYTGLTVIVCAVIVFILEAVL